MAKEKAIAFANKYGLEEQVEELITEGYTPEEALALWDII